MGDSAKFDINEIEDFQYNIDCIVVDFLKVFLNISILFHKYFSTFKVQLRFSERKHLIPGPMAF